ncbi:MAG TPA: metalloregulator ArsR/SmtB family transcription factor [Polyangiales bacterium]|nr:metalloregulator ArsR/SmtB family transcription factor [Polyangiales bacterium]
MDAFEVLAAPARRQILAELGRAASSVNTLATLLDANQPAVSKHLKVLRDAGFVSCRGSAQQRIYQLEPGPFRELDAWLAPYRRLWTRHLDALERFLDKQEESHETQRLSQKRTRPGARRARRRTLGARVRS